jgi:hypothetical protein
MHVVLDCRVVRSHATLLSLFDGDERRVILYLQYAMGPALRRPYDLMSSPLDERKRAPRQDRKGVPQDSRDLPRLPLETDDPLAGYTDRLDERFVAKQQSG